MNDTRQVGHEKHWPHTQEPAGAADPHLPAAWLQFIRYCTELGHGEIEKLKIQNGLPMIAELAVKKVKFVP